MALSTAGPCRRVTATDSAGQTAVEPRSKAHQPGQRGHRAVADVGVAEAEAREPRQLGEMKGARVADLPRGDHERHERPMKGRGGAVRVQDQAVPAGGAGASALRAGGRSRADGSGDWPHLGV
jgi:hypothetical protein